MNDRVYVMRESIVRLTQMLSGKSVRVTQQGISAYVKAAPDGRPVQVNLPYIPDNATDELIDAIQGFLDHEVAHILFTDFTALKGGKVEFMVNAVEDTRIERLMAERFQGSAHNLANTGKFFLDKYIEPKFQEALASGNVAEQTAILMIVKIRAMAGQTVFADYLKGKESIMQPVHDVIGDLASKIASASSTSDSIKLGKEIKERLKRASEPKASPPPPPSAPATPPPSPEDEEEEHPPGSSDDEDEDEEQEEETPPPPAGDEDEDEEPTPPEDEESLPTGVSAESKPEPDELSVDDELPEEADSRDASGEATGHKDDSESDMSAPVPISFEEIEKEMSNKDYDETMSTLITNSTADAAKDSDYLVFTTDADVVEPMKVGRDYQPSMLTSIQNAVDHMVAPLQKDLERAIAARSLSVWSSGHRSGRLHSANLSRLVVGDDRVFRRKHEAVSKDVAVELVVDASGSMDGSKITIATQTAYALAAVLERIGISCEVICFTTGKGVADSATLAAEAAKIGRRYSRVESLYMPILKGFGERMTVDVKARFGWLPHSNILRNNVDGECIEIAARRLMARRETGKIMMVLSDGAPYASGEVRSLGAHLKKTIAKITKAGVNVVGIGIQSDEVTRFYPKSMVLNDVASLPSVVLKELRAMIIK